VAQCSLIFESISLWKFCSDKRKLYRSLPVGSCWLQFLGLRDYYLSRSYDL
jgi:hypothetical protein